MAPQIILTSSDGRNYLVEYELAKISPVLKATLIDHPPREGIDLPEKKVILDCVHSAPMTKILQWLRQHKNHIPKLDHPATGRFHYDDCEWCQDHFQLVDPAGIGELIAAAKYLQLASLEDVLVRKMVSQMRDGPPDEIRNRFGIQGNAESEIEMIRRERERDFASEMDVEELN